MNILFFMVAFLFFMVAFLLYMYMYLVMLDEKIMIFELLFYSFQLMEMKLYFYFDYYSIFFLMIVSFITSITFLYSYSYMSLENNKIMFMILTSMFVISMYLLILSMNMWMILIGWDLLGVVSYFLVIFYQSDISNYSGMVTIMTNRWGDIGMIMAIYFFFYHSSLDMFMYKMEINSMLMFLFMLMMGAFTKSAQFPFSSWLPLAMAAPTPISALVHSSTLVTAGVYLLIRFSLLIKNNSVMVEIFMLLVFMTSIFSGVFALIEYDIKKIIAFSTLSQLSLMMMIVFFGNELIGYMHILTHALFKALLFLCSGVFIHDYFNNQDIRNFSFIYKSNNLIVGIFMLCSLSLMGFPFLSGFYSKDLLLEFIYSMNFNLLFTMMIMISVILTCFYSIRMIMMSMFLGKKGYKFIMYKNWDLMYCSIFMIVSGVLSLGSMLNWLILDKLNLIYLSINVKLINIFLLMLGMMYMYMYQYQFLKMNKWQNYFIYMIFISNLIGTYSNYLILNMSFYSNYLEMFLENKMIFSNKNLLLIFSKFLLMFKYLYFLISIFFLLVILQF